MFKNKQIWSAIATFVLLLGVTNITLAERSEKSSESIDRFRRIEQPQAVKIAVTLGGLALIGAELWWFLFAKTKAQKAISTSGIQEVDITVDRGYIPERIVVKAGEPVRLNFFRKDPSNCLEKVLLPDFHKAADLSLNETTSVEFTPEKTGDYTFNCSMNMFRGVIEVREETEEKITEVKEKVGSQTNS